MENSYYSAAQAASKKDKRLHSIGYKLYQLSDMFENERDYHYREMLRNLQTSLSSLHSGDNPELQEQILDLGEVRDKGLIELSAWREYQLERIEKEYSKSVSVAEEEFTKMSQKVQEKLLAKLEYQCKRLKEDKQMLDVANDHSFFLAEMSDAGSPFLNLDRRVSRRRQHDYEEMSGLSSGGSSKRRRGGNGTAAEPSDTQASDLENILASRESANHSRSKQCVVQPAKGDEQLDDLTIIRRARAQA